jgi:predicted nucleic acid-binding Zn ribbon protein
MLYSSWGDKMLEYDGLRFSKDKKTGYYLSTTKIDGKRKRLHRYVWEKYNGEIPKGYAVHHKDNNKGNNDISNLELIKKEQHAHLHGTIYVTNELNDKKRRNTLEKMIPKAAEWHKSEEGKQWHKKHYSNIIATLEKREYVCVNCGKSYKSRPTGKNRFCSNNCKSAWRRKNKIDQEERVCIVCGKTYFTNKYSKSVTCSKSCGVKYGYIKRRESEKR